MPRRTQGGELDLEARIDGSATGRGRPWVAWSDVIHRKIGNRLATQGKEVKWSTGEEAGACDLTWPATAWPQEANVVLGS